jgi:hypothetical protein
MTKFLKVCLIYTRRMYILTSMNIRPIVFFPLSLFLHDFFLSNPSNKKGVNSISWDKMSWAWPHQPWGHLHHNTVIFDRWWIYAGTFILPDIITTMRWCLMTHEIIPEQGYKSGAPLTGTHMCTNCCIFHLFPPPFSFNSPFYSYPMTIYLGTSTNVLDIIQLHPYWIPPVSSNSQRSRPCTPSPSLTPHDCESVPSYHYHITHVN